MDFKDFLELSEIEMFKYLTGIKLHWWERIEIKLINKWWSFKRKANKHLRAIDLWESIYKGRF